MIIFKIIYCKIAEIFYGLLAYIFAKLSTFFKPDYEKIEKIMKQKKSWCDMEMYSERINQSDSGYMFITVTFDIRLYKG